MRRRRERTRWTDTPVAKVTALEGHSSFSRTISSLCSRDHCDKKANIDPSGLQQVFTEEEEWKDLRWKSLIDALRLKLIAEKKGPREAFDKYDLDKDGFLNK